MVYYDNYQSNPKYHRLISLNYGFQLHFVLRVTKNRKKKALQKYKIRVLENSEAEMFRH